MVRPTVIYTTMNDLSMHGGIETMVPQEVMYLASLGFDVHVISPNPRRSSRLAGIDGVREAHFPVFFQRLPWLMKDFLTVLWICSYVLRAKRKSRILTVSFSAMDGAGASLARLLGADSRVVLRIVGPLSYEVVHFASTRKRRYVLYSKLFMLVEAFSYLVADSILPVSEFEEANIRSYGVADDKIKTIRCGIDPQRFDGLAESDSLGMPDGRLVIMFVGRMVEKNGPSVIAEAVHVVMRSHPECCFVFVGDGPLKPPLENELASEITAGRVVFTGFREDIPELHSQADVYVGHVSSLVEGLGQTVFEAMMSGLPVVVGDDWISRRIITHRENGFLVPKDEPGAVAAAVTFLMENPQERDKLGAAARATALETLSFDAMMAEVTRSF